MKKKIFIGMSIFFVIFLLSGIYIIYRIEMATSELDNLVMLHEVALLREELLMHIKKVQSELAVSHTRYAISQKTLLQSGIQMGKMAESCLGCHHAENVIKRITALRNRIENYKESLSRVLTIRASAARMQVEQDAAFWKGQELIAEVNELIDFTSHKLEEKTRSVKAHITRTKYILYILLIATPVLSLVLLVPFLRSFTKPINELLKATKMLEGGNLQHRVEGLSDEFGELARSFNKMAGALKDQMQKMQRTEQMAVCSEMAVGLTHELKNSLSSLKVSVEVLLEELDLVQRDREVFFAMKDEILRIQSLMQDTLDFAKPPRPLLMLVNINNLILTITDYSLKKVSSSRKTQQPIRIVKNLDEHLPATKADPAQLRQVFLNLLLNAVEAMPDGGTLTIRTSYEESDRSIRIRISDTGMGIAGEFMDKLFQPFFTTKPKGTGLGLSITARLIEQHGGSIRAGNNPEGGGTFEISLPIMQGKEVQAP